MPLRRFLCFFACLLLLAGSLPTVGHCTQMATDISIPVRITNHSCFYPRSRLFDHDLTVPTYYPDHSWMTLEYEEGIGSLYLIFHHEYGTYSLTNEDTGKTVYLGEHNFLHDFIDLEAIFGAPPTAVTLSFDNGTVWLNELCVFTSGEVPDFVQKWEPPADGQADLLLFSAHGDDEQLFFAGLLPYYAGELDYTAQVVYLTNHRANLSERCHEMLDGLYAMGVTNYPVFGPYNDHLSESLEDEYRYMESQGVSKEELTGFVVEQLRRFRPLAAVTHDVEGEYGHGQHMLFADLLMKASELSPDPEKYPELAEQYGTWDVPKTYLHLYPENKIVLDLDQPLTYFNGMTAYEAARDLGFPCHKTQYRSYSWYFAQSDRAADIELYNPCYYGLFRSTVGEDVKKNDIFENLTPYSQLAENTEPDIQQSEQRSNPSY